MPALPRSHCRPLPQVLSSAAVQATAFLAVRAAGSLTVKVWATVRNVAIVLLGVLAYQESVTPAQVLGYTGEAAACQWRCCDASRRPEE